MEEIAHGGMGTVFRARQINLNRMVALKLISGGALATEDSVKRFKAEAEAAASLAHPNIVPIFEIGEHQGQHYFSMGLIEGPNLAEYLARHRPRDAPASVNKRPSHPHGRYRPREAARLLAIIARAVHYAHQRGVLHRDIKPSNILIDERGTPHLTDFGLAKLTEKESTLTFTNAILGTPAYMAPEQARGHTREVTTAADIYGLGAVLYETLTGSPPFGGGTTFETIRQVLEQEPRRPSILNCEVDRDLETICLKCLEKEPGRRYGSAEALADDLRRWLEHEPILARRSTPINRVTKWARRQPVLAAIVALLHLVFVAGISGVFWQWWRAEAQLTRAERAESEALALLHEAKVNFVRANRLTGRPGQRSDSLVEIVKAAKRTNSVDLRNEAIACLVLPDASLVKEWQKTRGWDSFRFDATHRRYVTNDALGLLTIRDVDTDEVFGQMPVQGGIDVDYSIAFSADDRWLATVDAAGQTRLWEWQKSHRSLELPQGARILVFTPDSRFLVVQYADNSLHFLNPATGVAEKVIPAPTIPNRSHIRFSAKGEKFLVANNGQITVLNTSDGRQLTIFAPDESKHVFNSAAWHPDGRRVACSWVNHIGLWDAETGRKLAAFEGHESAVVGLDFTGNGEFLLSSSWDSSTRFWNIESRREVLRLPDSGNVLSVSQDDRRLSFQSWDHLTVKLYALPDLTIGQRVTLPAPTRHQAHLTGQAVWSPDGGIGIADIDALYLFTLRNPTQIAVLDVPETGAAAFAPDGSALLTGGPHGAQRWPIQRMAGTSELQVGPPRIIEPTRGLDVSWIEISRDGEWFVAQSGHHVLTCRTAPASEPVRFDDALRLGGPPRISPDGRWVATITPAFDHIQVWNGRTGQLVTNIPVRGAWQCAFSADGRWLGAMLADSLTVWSTSDWSVRSRIAHPSVNHRHGLDFSPDNSIIATFASDWKIRLLRFDTGEELAHFPTGRGTTSVRFNAAGDQLLVGNESGFCEIWNLRGVREELASMNLDWDLPSYPSVQPASSSHRFRTIVHTNQ